MLRRRTLTLSALLLLTAAACGACASVTPLPDGPMLDVTWQLVELAGEPVGNAADGTRATLLLGSDGRASGNAGCNRYGGGYSMDGTEMRFSALAMTRMYCEGFMALETNFGAALQNTRAWRIADDHLELMADGRVLARLTRV